jgi:hypothetical protein
MPKRRKSDSRSGRRPTQNRLTPIAMTAGGAFVPVGAGGEGRSLKVGRNDRPRLTH